MRTHQLARSIGALSLVVHPFSPRASELPPCCEPGTARAPPPSGGFLLWWRCRDGLARGETGVRELTMAARSRGVAYMARLTLELPPQGAQRSFNLRRWAELLADRELARIEGRIEADRHGHIIVVEKRALSFDAGAREVWLCTPEDGKVTFLSAPNSLPLRASKGCPGFPDQIRLG